MNHFNNFNNRSYHSNNRSARWYWDEVHDGPMGDEYFFTAREEAGLNILADNPPPSETELHQEIPCKFSFCKELNENMNTEA